MGIGILDAVPSKSGQLTRIKKAFVEIYGGSEDDVRVFFAPGRVLPLRQRAASAQG
jgi:hypothetical protein